MFCCLLVEFAPVIVVVAAYPGAFFINGARSALTKVFTAPVNQHVPAAALLVDLDAGM